MRDILDSTGAAMAGISVLSCRPKPDANVITSKLLGGSWQVQTVGDTAWKADVQALVTGLTALTLLQEAWAEGEAITVRMDGMAYTGLIEANPASEIVRRAAIANRKFKMTFVLLITSSEEA